MNPEPPIELKATLVLKEIADGSLAMVFADGHSVSLSESDQARAPASVEGLRFSATTVKGGVNLQAEDRNAIVKAENFDGWSMVLAAGGTATLRISTAKKFLEVTTPDEPGNAATLQLPDGGRAVMGAGSAARFDFFADQSYTLSGAGNVQAVSADGNAWLLSPCCPPMTGGPLVVASDTPIGTHYERRTPTVPVQLCGTPGGELMVKFGTRAARLTETTPVEIALPNGTVARCEWNRATRDVRWFVDKGDLRISIEGIPGWKYFGASGQSAALLWDQGNQAVDLRNLTPEAAILAGLPNQTYARIETNATFQYMQATSELFATSSCGGRVTLFNAFTGRETELKQGNLVFKSGQPLDSGRRAASKNTVQLAWRSDAQLDVSCPSGRMLLEPRDEKVLAGPNGSQLEVQFRQTGEIFCKSLNGDCTIYPGLVQKTSVDLSENTGICFGVSRQQGVLVASAFAGNLTAVDVSVAERLNSPLNPGDSITMFAPGIVPPGPVSPHSVYYNNSSHPGRVTGAGSDFLKGLPQTSSDPWSFGRYNNNLYESRIFQPPVSVVR